MQKNMVCAAVVALLTYGVCTYATETHDYVNTFPLSYEEKQELTDGFPSIQEDLTVHIHRGHFSDRSVFKEKLSCVRVGMEEKYPALARDEKLSSAVLRATLNATSSHVATGISVLDYTLMGVVNDVANQEGSHNSGMKERYGTEVRALLEYGAKPSSPALRMWVARQKALVNEETENGDNTRMNLALWVALRYAEQFPEVTQLIIQHVHINELHEPMHFPHQKTTWHPLFYACKMDNFDVMRALVSKGVDINVCNKADKALSSLFLRALLAKGVTKKPLRARGSRMMHEYRTLCVEIAESGKASKEHLLLTHSFIGKQRPMHTHYSVKHSDECGKHYDECEDCYWNETHDAVVKAITKKTADFSVISAV